MRTNIVLDDRLVEEGFKYTREKTKKGLVKQALEEFIVNHSRRDLRELKGQIKFRDDYDHKKLRNDIG
jgi:Arc/MetJ family transcription regulator